MKTMTLTDMAVNKMMQLGATEAEVYVRKTKATRVNFAEKIENMKTAQTTGMSLRAVLGKKVATYSTSILSENQVDEAAEKVLKIAKASPEDPHWRHINKKFGNTTANRYFDETIGKLEAQQIIERLNSAMRRMRDFDTRVKPAFSSLSAITSNASVVNSYGERAEREETFVLASLNAKAEEGTMMTNAREVQCAKFWKKIDFEKLAEKAAEKAVKFLRAKPLESRKVAVVVKNQIFANFLGLMLGESVNAESVQSGRSAFIGKIGAEIASEEVTVVDDGTMPSGWNTRPFDDEGHASQKTMVVEKGTLRNYLYDTYSSLKDNVESTGNCFRRDYWTRPQPQPSNFILEAGSAKPEELVRDVQNGIYIEETIGEWLSDPISGNLNATIAQGYLIEHGELTQPIKGMVLSANFHELIKSQIELIGSDLDSSMQFYSPSLRIKELTIAGQS